MKTYPEARIETIVCLCCQF